MSNSSKCLVEAPTCSICLDFLLSDLYHTPCGHVFHRECIENSIRLGGGRCPNCRSLIQTRLLKALFFTLNPVPATQFMWISDLSNGSASSSCAANNHSSSETGSNAAQLQMRVDNMREVILGLQAQLGERMRELQAAAVSMETDIREKMMLQESCRQLQAQIDTLKRQLVEQTLQAQQYSVTVAQEILKARKSEDKCELYRSENASLKQKCISLQSAIELQSHLQRVAEVGSADVESMMLRGSENLTMFELREKYNNVVRVYAAEQQDWRRKMQEIKSTSSRAETECAEFSSRYEKLSNEVISLKRNFATEKRSLIDKYELRLSEMANERSSEVALVHSQLSQQHDTLVAKIDALQRENAQIKLLAQRLSESATNVCISSSSSSTPHSTLSNGSSSSSFNMNSSSRSIKSSDTMISSISLAKVASTNSSKSASSSATMLSKAVSSVPVKSKSSNPSSEFAPMCRDSANSFPNFSSKTSGAKVSPSSAIVDNEGQVVDLCASEDEDNFISSETTPHLSSSSFQIFKSTNLSTTPSLSLRSKFSSSTSTQGDSPLATSASDHDEDEDESDFHQPQPTSSNPESRSATDAASTPTSLSSLKQMMPSFHCRHCKEEFRGFACTLCGALAENSIQSDSSATNKSRVAVQPLMTNSSQSVIQHLTNGAPVRDVFRCSDDQGTLSRIEYNHLNKRINCWTNGSSVSSGSSALPSSLNPTNKLSAAAPRSPELKRRRIKAVTNSKESMKGVQFLQNPASTVS